jgi:hypothetical protein
MHFSPGQLGIRIDFRVPIALSVLAGQIVTHVARCDHTGVTNRIAMIIDDKQQIRRIVRHALADDFARVLERAGARR